MLHYTILLSLYPLYSHIQSLCSSLCSNIMTQSLHYLMNYLPTYPSMYPSIYLFISQLIILFLQLTLLRITLSSLIFSPFTSPRLYTHLPGATDHAVCHPLAADNALQQALLTPSSAETDNHMAVDTDHTVAVLEGSGMVLFMEVCLHLNVIHILFHLIYLLFLLFFLHFYKHRLLAPIIPVPHTQPS